MKAKINLRTVLTFEQLKNFYPVGTILSGLPLSFDPNNYIPGTKWQKIPDNTYLVNASSATGAIVNPDNLIIKESNIRAFNPSVSTTGHSHSYYFEDVQSCGHGDRTVKSITNNIENKQMSGDGSEHSHTITFGGGVAIELNNIVNHTQMSAWIRTA